MRSTTASPSSRNLFVAEAHQEEAECFEISVRPASLAPLFVLAIPSDPRRSPSVARPSALREVEQPSRELRERRMRSVLPALPAGRGRGWGDRRTVVRDVWLTAVGAGGEGRGFERRT
jgi:hypothetical protein